MKKISLTSVAFTGEVVLNFNDFGLLTGFDTQGAELTEAQQIYFLKRLPKELSAIERLLAGSNTAKLTEINTEVSFDMFWNRYNEKVRSSKKKAYARWVKMPQAEQIKAYNYINKYNRSLGTGIARKYAETYLNAELWNN